MSVKYDQGITENGVFPFCILCTIIDCVFTQI